MKDTPRIIKVVATSPTTLVTDWKDGRHDKIALAGWIATGDDLLAPLRDWLLFRKARVEDYGAAVAWDDDDLRIDSTHLRMIADEQRPFWADEAKEWQAEIGLSNNEIADFLGISVSTWNLYKASEKGIPIRVGMLCRAALRDPLILQAHLKPRTTGRPRRPELVG